MTSWLPSFLSGGPAQPARVPTDKVVPVGYFDDTIIFRTYTIYVMLVYDEVLDVDQLHSGMTRLVSERKGWDKLGARFRRSADGKSLEHHIPTTFSASRRAVDFTSADHSDTKIDDHPVASKLPRPSPSASTPSVICDPDDFKSLIYAPGVPIWASDYLYSDRPQFGLRVVSFRDSTVVVVHWLHVAMDSIGLGSVLRAWRLMLEGREDEIPEPLPADEYPLAEYGLAPKEKHLLEDVHLKMSGVLAWVARNLWMLAVTPKECGMLCIPAKFWKKLREQALADLAKSGGGDGGWVSEGDVLLAWFSRLALAHYDKDSAAALAPVNIQQVVEVRGRMPERFPPNRPYLGNAIAFMIQLMPIRDALTTPISQVAGAIRKALVTQSTPEQCEAYGALVRQDPVNRAPPFFGESRMHLLLYTNWCKAKLYDTDLGAAVKGGDGSSSGKKKAAPPRYIQTNQGPYDFPDGIFVVGKDAHENYWISAYRPKGLWGVVAKVIREEWSSE
ncbi:uncharacterized protein B0I36DRAFT_361234 [Microdochium trichocladiopsis]|uniref:LysR family regulatory protein n=1 Tax=Microdochium trichocladiopsis TaxID=1682393 RepID=A0A9P9BRI1_9PEZI|nr:uncharacterized protein B0I36DRAFT_361234 [Microdochium trichocladiopsis]KAH7035923.1 hypothetical protein B0I36DRAFT_361234 [Microdochium trichocladiopsis]